MSGHPENWRAPSDFAAAIAAAGLGRPDIIGDGSLHRFCAEGDRPGTRNAWYVLHLDGCPAGAFGSWKHGHMNTWSARTDEPLTPRKQADIRRMVEQAKAKRDTEIRDRWAEAATRAADIWNKAKTADSLHPYLVLKGVGAHGLRQQGAALLVPILVADRLVSVQNVYPNGDKRFLAGGRTGGGYYLIDDGTRRPEVLVAEGFATGASLHEAIGAAVYVAFNANNLLAVARTARASHLDQTIIICADDDRWTDGNPGLTKARAAALAIGAKLLVPDFTGMDLSTKPTDFNDWYRLRRVVDGRVAA